MRATAIFALAALFTACDTPPPEGEGGGPQANIVIDEPGQIAESGEVVMKVNGYPVGRKETDHLFRQMGVPPEKVEEFMNSQMGTHILEDYALATALYRDAVAIELHKDPEVQMMVALSERQALSRSMHARLAIEKITDAAIQEWVTANEARLNLPQIRARQIVVPLETHAEDLMERLNGGEDFAALALNHSIDEETSKNGGEMGWFTSSDRPEIGEALFSHTTTKLIGPIETDSGYYIVEILERRDSTPQDERRVLAQRALEQEAALNARNEVRDAMNIEWTTPRADPHMPMNHPTPGSATEGDAHGGEGGGGGHGGGDGHGGGEGGGGH